MDYPGIDICKFLPRYKSQDDEGFQAEVSSKMEYQKFKASATEAIPKPGQLFKHQALFLRWIRFNNSVLVMSDMGTGKTIQFIAPAEYYHKYLHKRPMSPYKLFDDKIEGNIKRCIIIVKNDMLRDNVENEIINYGYKDTDFTVKRRRTIDSKRAQAAEAAVRTRKIGDFYDIWTQEKLGTHLHKLSDDEIRRKYNDSIIVFDEIHAIKLGERELKKSSEGTRKKKIERAGEMIQGIDINKEVLRLFTVTQGCKYVIASATPMINSASEIFSIFNLIVPPEKRINQMVDGVLQNELSVDTLSPTIEPTLREYFRGRVSYVARLDNGVVPEMMGEPIGETITGVVKKSLQLMEREFRYMRPYDMSIDLGDTKKSLMKLALDTVVYKVYMSDYQTDRCNSIHLMGDVRDFRSSERTAAMFVYPGTRKQFTMESGDITSLLKNRIRDYGKYLSCKYAEIVRLSEEEDGKSFCYTEFKTDGSNILSEYFKSQGWERIDPSKQLVDVGPDKVNRVMVTVNRKRYAVLDGKTSQNKTYIRNILNLANHPDNTDGRYLRVIVGTRVSRDGINLFGFNAMHLIDGGWTDAGREQAMMRVIRAVSHEKQVEELRKREGPNALFKVKVYRHCAIQKRPNPLNVRDVYAECLKYGITPVGDRQQLQIMIAQKIVERINTIHQLMDAGATHDDIDNYYAQFRLATDPPGDLPALYQVPDGSVAYYGGIDVDEYVSGYFKTVYIKNVERIMREEAFDRAINNDRNARSNAELGVAPMTLPTPEESTYNIIDPPDAVNDLLQQMVFYFSNKSTLSKEDIMRYVDHLRTKDLSKTFPTATIDIIADRASTSVIPTLDYTGYPVRIIYENGIFYRSTQQRRMNSDRSAFPTSEYVDVINTSRVKPIAIPVFNELVQNRMGMIQGMERLVEEYAATMRMTDAEVIAQLSSIDLWQVLYQLPRDELYSLVAQLDVVVRNLHPTMKQLIVEYASMRDYYLKNTIHEDLGWLNVYLKSLTVQLSDILVAYLMNRFRGYVFIMRESQDLMSRARSTIMKLKKEPKNVDHLRIKRLPMTAPRESPTKTGGELIIVHTMAMFKEIINPYNIEHKLNSMAYTYRVFKPASQQPYRTATYTEIIAYNYVIQLRTMNTYAAVRDQQVYGVVLADGNFRINDKTSRSIIEKKKDERSRRCESFLDSEKIRIMKYFWDTNENSRGDIYIPVVRSRGERAADIETLKKIVRKTSGGRLTEGAASLIKTMTGIPALVHTYNQSGSIISTTIKKPVSGPVRDHMKEINMLEVDKAINAIPDEDVQFYMKFLNMTDTEACQVILRYMRKYNAVLDQFHLQ